MTVKIGIIGLGYWGPNLVRNFAQATGGQLLAVSDLDEGRRNRIAAQYPTIQCFADAEALIHHTDLDAVVIATPINSHYDLAKKALLAGKHVLVEKPLATSAVEVRELMNLAAEKGLLLMVDHTFLYTGAVQKIKELVEQGEIGTLNYFDSTRINLGLFNPNWSVVWDLAVHDLSIFFYITGGKKPVSVSAVGQSHTAMGIEDLAYTTLFFEDGMMAHIASSWISPVKIRKTLIGGSKKMVIYDDVEPTEKIKIYDSGFTVRTPEEMHRWLVDYRFGDIFIPKLEQKEALSGVAHDFIHCIKTGGTPLSNAGLGLQVVAVMEAAQESIRNQGAPVKLSL
ncbi:MAG: Gfo/Idh/MocA family oxidoreductase [Bacteroidetes bacterium]|nr:Gfo/Idh/MocA family oxidoreductase [Bacteroidota bacterium]